MKYTLTESMLSTDDNPYDPFDNYPQWEAWDRRAGYHTSDFIARIVLATGETSIQLAVQAINNAVDEAVRENVQGNYVKVSRTMTYDDGLPD